MSGESIMAFRRSDTDVYFRYARVFIRPEFDEG